MSALSYALATAIGNQPSPTIALRDLVALEQGLSHRAIARVGSRRFVAYAASEWSAYFAAFDECVAALGHCNFLIVLRVTRIAR